MVNIVIPCYNNYHLTNKLLYSLYRHEVKNIDHVIVVDDCSDDPEVFSGLNWWKQEKMLPLQVIHKEENSGFLLTANEGMKAVTGSKDDVTLLISNDVQIHGKFINQITQAISLNILDGRKTLVGGILYSQDTGWNTFNGMIFPYLEGWLLATTNEGWKELGYFDEDYCPCDFEDVHLSTAALSKGYELVALNTPSLVHLGAGTLGYNPKREAQTKTNQKKFEEKWVK